MQYQTVAMRMFFTKKTEDKKSEESVLESLKTDVLKDTTIK